MNLNTGGLSRPWLCELSEELEGRGGDRGNRTRGGGWEFVGLVALHGVLLGSVLGFGAHALLWRVGGKLLEFGLCEAQSHLDLSSWYLPIPLHFSCLWDQLWQLFTLHLMGTMPTLMVLLHVEQVLCSTSWLGSLVSVDWLIGDTPPWLVHFHDGLRLYLLIPLQVMDLWQISGQPVVEHDRGVELALIVPVHE